MRGWFVTKILLPLLVFLIVLIVLLSIEYILTSEKFKKLLKNVTGKTKRFFDYIINKIKNVRRSG